MTLPNNAAKNRNPDVYVRKFLLCIIEPTVLQESPVNSAPSVIPSL